MPRPKPRLRCRHPTIDANLERGGHYGPRLVSDFGRPVTEAPIGADHVPCGADLFFGEASEGVVTFSRNSAVARVTCHRATCAVPCRVVQKKRGPRKSRRVKTCVPASVPKRRSRCRQVGGMPWHRSWLVLSSAEALRKCIQSAVCSHRQVDPMHCGGHPLFLHGKNGHLPAKTLFWPSYFT